MKRCPRCSQTYTDDELNFCLNDGEFLTNLDANPAPTHFVDDSPPTIAMDPTRVTNPTNWPISPPPTQWQQPQSMVQQQVGQQQMFVPYAASMSPSQTLAVVSLCLGIGSVTVRWCCSL